MAEASASPSVSLSGRTRVCEAFVAMSTRRALGVLVDAVEHAARSGDIVVGELASVDAQWSWRYEIRRVAHDPAALSLRELLSRLQPWAGALDSSVRVSFVEPAVVPLSALHEPKLHRGTCRVCVTAGAKRYLRARQSPQVPPWLGPRVPEPIRRRGWPPRWQRGPGGAP